MIPWLLEANLFIYMVFKAIRLSETFATKVTNMSFLSLMHSCYVTSEVDSLAKAFVRNITNVSFLSLMYTKFL